MEIGWQKCNFSYGRKRIFAYMEQPHFKIYLSNSIPNILKKGCGLFKFYHMIVQLIYF